MSYQTLASVNDKTLQEIEKKLQVTGLSNLNSLQKISQMDELYHSHQLYVIDNLCFLCEKGHYQSLLSFAEKLQKGIFDIVDLELAGELISYAQLIAPNDEERSKCGQIKSSLDSLPSKNLKPINNPKILERFSSLKTKISRKKRDVSRNLDIWYRLRGDFYDKFKDNTRWYKKLEPRHVSFRANMPVKEIISLLNTKIKEINTINESSDPNFIFLFLISTYLLFKALSIRYAKNNEIILLITPHLSFIEKKLNTEFRLIIATHLFDLQNYLTEEVIYSHM